MAGQSGGGGVRSAQRHATRTLILEAAVSSLLEKGYAATSTVAVQHRAGVSRGALLHHFPSRALLFGALVEHLVASNEEAVLLGLEAAPLGTHRGSLRGGLQVLFEALRRPAFQAELELWTAARTDPELRVALRSAESGARRDLRRVVDVVFGGEVTSVPAYPVVADMTIALLRGLIISLPLRESTASSEALLDEWSTVLQHLLSTADVPATSPHAVSRPRSS